MQVIGNKENKIVALGVRLALLLLCHSGFQHCSRRMVIRRQIRHEDCGTGDAMGGITVPTVRSSRVERENLSKGV